MSKYDDIAREICDTITRDELSAADLAIHLDIDYTHMTNVDDGIRLVRAADDTIRYWGIERDKTGEIEGYSWADYEPDEYGTEHNIGQDGGPLRDENDLSRALREIDDFITWEPVEWWLGGGRDEQ